MSSLVEVVKFKILSVHFVFSNVILSQVVSVVRNKEHSNNPLYIAVCSRSTFFQSSWHSLLAIDHVYSILFLLVQLGW